MEAFRELLLQPTYRYQAYRFLPLLDDHERPEFFEGVAAEIHNSLKGIAVIVREDDGELILPEDARRAGAHFRTVFSAPPPPATLCKERLVSAEIECFGQQLIQLGVYSATMEDTFQCLSDRQWLSKRPLNWFLNCYEYLKAMPLDDSLVERLRKCPIVPVEGTRLSCDSDQPIYLSASSDDRIFLESVPPTIKAPVAFLEADFRSLIEKQPGLTAWLQNALGVFGFSRPNYCVDIVSRLKRDYAAMDEAAIISGARFLARFSDHTVNLSDIPVVLNNSSRSLVSALRSAGMQVVTPTTMDPGAGWQEIFETDQDKSHLAVLSDCYLNDTTIIRRADTSVSPDARIFPGESRS